MSATRGQNVSVLQLHSPEFREPPITTFTDTGGSLRTAPRIHSSRIEKSSFLSDKNFKHHSFENSTSKALDKCHKEESGPNNKSFSVIITTGVNSSSFLNSPGRELSPVRWCNREVDGVYLGKSGWVQVQQRSLDENRKLSNHKVNPISSLPNSVKFSNDSELDERRESSRPICLPLSVEEQKNREITIENLRFKQEFRAVSPPPITPIISPPPAFKDSGLENDFSRHSTKKILVGKPPLLPRSKAIVDCESSLKLPLNESNFTNSLPCQSRKLTPPLIANSQQQNRFSHLPHTKSLEDDSSKKIYLNENKRSPLPASLFDFCSLDRSIRKQPDGFKINETDSSVNGHDHGERDLVHFTTRKSSPYERLNTEAISAEGFHSYHLSRNVSRTSCSNSTSTRKYSKRSSSLDSSSSSSSSDQNSSNLSPRGLNLKENWQGSEGPFSCDYRALRVRRSRSLQLSEKHSPNTQLADVTSAGKSWDQISKEKFSQSRSGKNQHFPAPSQDHCSTTTTLSEGTHSVIPHERSRKHLQRMIRLENDRQEELFREAKKEARIISEFLNGTRSRAAARNLLMHRYLNQPEDEEIDDEEDKRKTLKQIPSEPEYGVHFIGTSRNYQSEHQCRNEAVYANKISAKGHMSKPLESKVWSHCSTRLNSSSPAFFQNTFATSDEDTSRMSLHGQSNQNGKAEKKTELLSTSLESTKNYYAKKKKRKMKMLSQFPSDCRDSTCSSANSDKSQSFLLNQVQKLKQRHQKSNFEQSTNNLDISEVNRPLREAKAIAQLEVANDHEKHQKPFFSLYNESPTTPSSSKDIWLNGSGSKGQITYINSKASSPVEEYGLNSPIAHGDFTKFYDVFLRRPESLPTNGDEIFVNSQQKSLSLPKSFMSERNEKKHERQRNYSLWEEQYIENPTLDNCTNQFPSESSRTAPATPVHDLKNSKHNITVKEKCRKSSSAPILDEPCDSEWPAKGYSFESGDSSKIRSSENNNFRRVPEKMNIGSSSKTVTSSESTLRKFRKKFSLKFSKAKENLENNSNLWIESSIRNVNLASSQEVNPPKKYVSKSADIQIENKVLNSQKFGLTSAVWPPNKDHKGNHKVMKNKKCSSRDSGIQVDNLGNMAEGSYESLDAVNFDETESMKKARQNDRKISEKSFGTHTVSNQNYMNKFQTNNLHWRCQNEDYFKGVRRTNSDLGGQREFFRGARDHCCRSNTSTSSFTNGTTRKDGLTQKDCEWFSERILLKRSFSQPLGVNDFSPLMRQRSLTIKSHNFSEDDRDQNEVTSEDEAISGSEMSFASLKERKKSFELQINKPALILAEAVWDHVAMEPDELPFRAGDVIKVLNMCDRDWWWGIAAESSGYFPSAFVRLRVSQEETVEDCSDINEKEASHHVITRRCRRSTSFLSTDQIRSKVVWELLNTERSFVKVLHDIAEGFIVECRRRSDMFTPAQIDTIFSNLENLLAFQRKFLCDLEARVDLESPHKSCVGETFLHHKSGFQVYSEYCNSHPMAIATLQELYHADNYNKFFEACRLMRGLNEIPLDGYLLTPVQRICKYPLQLAELLKYTKPGHPDHARVCEALEAMREVANLINERKRKMESLEKLEAWQQRVEGWEGEDLIENSSQLIHQGEAVRITSGMWTSNITLFLFDHQIIYCKKDLLKKNTFIYKGRLCLDTSEVIDLPDGRDQQMGVTIRNGLKIYSCLKDKWLLICCRSTEEKAKWLESFAQERRIVAQDVENGLAISPAARQLARMSAKSKRRPPASSRNKDNFKMEPHLEGVNLITNLLNPNGVKMGRKVGTWFSFGGKKGSRGNMKSKNSLNFTG